ncbi:cytochrome P450 [Sphingobacterium sp. KU25419]|nr:cytochrome P450 [Sphingobacterium sp. KU25419]
MIKSILTTLGIGTFLSLQAQALKEDLELYGYNNEPIIQALRSVTLKNGFIVPKGSIVTISIGGSPRIW